MLGEMLTGKRCDVCILDRNVSTTRLMGANRRYIEEEIPHYATLMCDDVGTLLSHAEVLVVGRSTKRQGGAVAASSPDVLVVDLTRGAV